MAKNTVTKTAVKIVEAEEKKKALKTAMDQIEKQFGKGAVMRLGENAGMNVEHIKTGSLTLDVALGIGGIPKGRIVEIYGPESSGKPPLHFTALPKHKRQAVLPHLSTLSTPLTPFMPQI